MSRLRLILALLVAAVYSMNEPRVALRRGWKAFKAILGILRSGDTTWQQWYKARMTCCRKCPIFFAPLQTCGSPLRKELRGVGCYCNCEYRNRDPNASCFGDDHIEHFQFGWNEHGAHPGWSLRDGPASYTRTPP